VDVCTVVTHSLCLIDGCAVDLSSLRSIYILNSNNDLQSSSLLLVPIKKELIAVSKGHE